MTVASQPGNANSEETTELLYSAAATGGNRVQLPASQESSAVLPKVSQAAEGNYTPVISGESANANMLTELIGSLTTLVQVFAKNYLPPVHTVPSPANIVDNSLPHSDACTSVINTGISEVTRCSFSQYSR